MADIENAFNNNKDTVINIVTKVLKKDEQDYIVNQIVSEIIKYYASMDDKLDKLLNNQAFVDNLMLQINEAHKSKHSLEELLLKSEKEREEALEELNELKKELANSSDIDFKKVLEEAEKALSEYNSKKYRKILKSYREDRKNREIVKNIATSHYLCAKSFASDFMQEKAEKEIEKAVTLNENNADYLGFYGVILFSQAKYEKALKYLTKSLAIQQEIGDKAGEGATLNNISQIYDAQGDYPTALKYLTKSLAIRQEIGDKAGMCATLFNLGHIALQNNERDKAMAYWKQVYTIATEINEYQALEALTKLAEQLGLEGGLKGRERRD